MGTAASDQDAQKSAFILMKLLFTAVLLFLVIFPARPQAKVVPVLERKITIQLTNERLPQALTRIGQEGGFTFSYNSDIIDGNRRINLNVTAKPVREILNEIFKGTIRYKEKSNHLILSLAPQIANSSTSVFVISGYVEDQPSGTRLADASVYEKSTLASAVTDQYGYYTIRLDKKDEPVLLSVSKKNYMDTVVRVTAPANQYMNIAIRPAGDSLKITAFTADSTLKKDDLFPYENDANLENIHDTLYRDIQMAILPFVGTNGRLSGNVINNYSINFFGGYSLGTRQIELGFFLNADRGDVSWLQIAGIGNAVGGNVTGIQGAGFFNVNRGETNAAQLAGFANTNLDETRGVQLAGIANTDLKPVHGVQVAGLSNVVIGPSLGVQVAGLDNVQVGNYQGSQIAGLTNIATDRISGSQIAGLFNYGRSVRGTQIGLINFADSLGGVPIGLLSFVNHGYHKIEVSADEVFYTNLAFRTGVRKFYNILSVGMKPENALGQDPNVWSFGYGIGTAPRLTRWMDLNIDLMTNHVSKGRFTNELSLLNKLYVGVDVKLARKMSLTLGATLNGYLTNNSYSDYPILFTDHSPHIIYEHNFNNNTNLKMWWGVKAGLRFL